MDILDKIAPVKEIRLKQRSEPWLNSDILECIHLRDNARLSFRKHGKQEDFIMFNKLRNKVQRLCKAAKSEYFDSQIEENRNNPKELWKQFKKLGYQQNPKSDSSVVLNIEGSNCHESTTIANHFKKIFTNVAAKLVEKLPIGKGTFLTSCPIFKNFYRARSNCKFHHNSCF